GSGNTAVGLNALFNSSGGSYNVALGYGAGMNMTSGSNSIYIGNPGLNTDNGVIRIGTPGTQGSTFIAGINGVTASQGVAVYINANGQLGTLTSSARFKYDIHNLGATSDKLMDLRPVSFRYKEAASDGSHPVQYGLIAEEVAKVYPDMVQYDKEGKPFTVYYQQLTPMMLDELQKAHKDIGELKSELAEVKQMLRKQNSEAASQPAQRPTLLVASVLAACLAAAVFFTSRSRQSR
ncbi:MAG TPA: tail fiber domain-containing protein, partial [Chthonomonadaceae bacterium]|nr:tail fiber domain-containing protein [Chthonomonadaceae bacterium]